MAIATIISVKGIRIALCPRNRFGSKFSAPPTRKKFCVKEIRFEFHRWILFLGAEAKRGIKAGETLRFPLFPFIHKPEW
jgi:hypothetical protein